jgi:hypothetical protein
MFHAILLALGMISPSPSWLGNCEQYQQEAQCTYNARRLSDDSLLPTIGVHWMIGPWATEMDIIHPAIVLLAGNKTVVLNATIYGGVVIAEQEVGMIEYSNFFPNRESPAAITIIGSKFQ